jgi:hypothetical protein
MRILLSEKQFNLIILSEGGVPSPKGVVYPEDFIKDYTPDQVRGEIRHYIDKGEFKKRSDVKNKNWSLYSRIKILDELDGLNLLDEFFKKNYNIYTPDEIKVIFNKIVDKYKKLYKQKKEFIRVYEKNGEHNKDYSFLSDYDFYGKIPRNEKRENLLKTFYEKVGYDNELRKMMYKTNIVWTPEKIKEEFKRLVKKYNDLYRKTGDFISFKNNPEYEFLSNYNFSGYIKGKKDKNIKNLLHYFKIETKHEEKKEKNREKEFNDLVENYKDKPLIVGSSDYERLRKTLKRLDEFYELVGKTKSESKGENYITEYLKSKDLNFIPQHKFCGLKYKKCLKFDFYLPKYNVLIEFDGRQHFEHVNWSGKQTLETMEDALKYIKNNDNLKNKYCDGKYNLYRIKHNVDKKIDEKSINEIMGEIFNDIESDSFKLTFKSPDIGYIDTQNYGKNESKMNTDPMANFNESIYRILNDIKKQYI